MIVYNALLIDLAGFSQFNGLAHTILSFPARKETIFAYANLSLLVAVGIIRQAGTSTANQIGCLDDDRCAIGLIAAFNQLAVAHSAGARAIDGATFVRFAVFIALAAQIDQSTGKSTAP